MRDAELQLSIAGDDVERRLRVLHDWLHREDELRGRVALRNRPIQDGQMGGVLDVIAVTLSGGGAGTVLIRSLSNYLIQSRADLKITVTGGNQREVTVDARRIKDPEALIRQVDSLLEPDAADPR
ncbi:effector-associated constant component EACC1 [Nocardia araoensis]|uniref:effector-associated constant component EACC1 n=1 Tax=Nocardia araoensis TaxID=228600 RepID=UPI0003051C44|nr:hypothetical protein [Nocardia araoensis]